MLKRRILVFFVFMAVFSAAFTLGTIMEVSEEDASLFVDEFDKLLSTLQDGNFAFEIFAHNTQIALPMFIPGFGVGWGVFSAFSTGFAFAALATMEPALLGVPPLALIFATPFGLMEIAAYSIAMSRSFLLIVAIFKKTPVKLQAKPALAEIGMVVGLLFAGGIIEAYMIETLSGLAPFEIN